MVFSMCVTKSTKCLRPAGKVDPCSAMDHHVVDDCVQQAICRGSNPNRNQNSCLRCVEADCEEANDDEGKDDGVEVIEFEAGWLRAGSVAMVAEVKGQTETVHHPAMERIGDWFHCDHRGDDNQHVSHGAYRSRCRADYSGGR